MITISLRHNRSPFPDFRHAANSQVIRLDCGDTPGPTLDHRRMAPGPRNSTEAGCTQQTKSAPDPVI